MSIKKNSPKPEQMNFLLQSYNNTQQSIQFFDTKAGAYLAGNGVAISLLINNIFPYISDLIKIDRSLSSQKLLWVADSALLLFTIIALWSLYETGQVFLQSFLVISPQKGFKLVNNYQARGLFWVSDIKTFVEKTSMKNYAIMMSSLTTKDIVEELAYETVKLSYIASEKMYHLERATKHFQKTIILWLVSVFLVGISRLFLQIIKIL